MISPRRTLTAAAFNSSKIGSKASKRCLERGQNEPEPEFAEVILSFQPAVNRYEYIKPILSKAK